MIGDLPANPILIAAYLIVGFIVASIHVYGAKGKFKGDTPFFFAATVVIWPIWLILYIAGFLYGLTVVWTIFLTKLSTKRKV